VPFAYQVDDRPEEYLCTSCYSDREDLTENDVTPIRWTSEWYDEYDDSSQELLCDDCGALLDQYEVEDNFDGDDDDCNCDACREAGSLPVPITRNLAAYMAAFIREATPRVAESVGA
jgi:hypothetical protein